MYVHMYVCIAYAIVYLFFMKKFCQYNISNPSESVLGPPKLARGNFTGSLFSLQENETVFHFVASCPKLLNYRLILL